MSAADRSEEMHGRCNARTRRGFCHAWPLHGGTRCYTHGGKVERSAQQKRASVERHNQAVATAMRDPTLLDVRRPVAISRILLDATPLLPTDDEVIQTARRRLATSLGPEAVLHAIETGKLAMLEPSDADLLDARVDLHERAMRLVASHGRTTIEAARQVDLSAIAHERVMPFLGELGLRVTKLIRRFVPPDRADEALEAFRAAVRETEVELTTPTKVR